MSRTYKRLKSLPAVDYIGTLEEHLRNPHWLTLDWGLPLEDSYARLKARHHACNHSGDWNAPRDYRRKWGIKMVRLRENNALIRHIRDGDWDNHSSTNRHTNANRYYI